MAQQLGRSSMDCSERLGNLRLLARSRDLGKVGVPDDILLKAGSLSQKELQEVRRHCEIGQRIALSLTDLAHIADFIYKHHERWDGRGYPLGLAGEEIPLESRIMALLEAFEAMTSERPYRRAMSAEEAVEEIRRCNRDPVRSRPGGALYRDPAAVREQVAGKNLSRLSHLSRKTGSPRLHNPKRRLI